MGPAPRVPGDGRVPRDTGAAALEFALVAPLLLFLLFGIIGVGYGLFELQAARATARDATRLAAVGIPDLTQFKRNVVCIGERNGIRAGALTGIQVAFHTDAGATTAPTVPAPGNYVSVRLTYLTTLDGLPFVGRVFADDDGQIAAEAFSRVEQVGTVVSGQTLTISEEVCAA